MDKTAKIPEKKPQVYPISNPKITRKCKRNDKQAPAMLNGSTKAQNVCFVRKKRSGSRNARHVRYAPKEGMNKTPSKCGEQVSGWNKVQNVKKQKCKGRKFWVYGEGIRHYDVVRRDVKS